MFPGTHRIEHAKLHRDQLIGWLEFNVPFQHKYGYSRDDIVVGTAIFAQLTAGNPYVLQLTAIFRLKLPIRIGIWALSNTWFLGPTANGISIGSAVFAGLTKVTDRQTDQQTERQTTPLRL